MAGFKNLEDLVGDLEAGLKKLRAGQLEPEELTPLVEDARELCDRLVLLRFKAHEFAYEVRKKAPEGGVDEAAAERQPVRPFRIGAAYQTSLIDAIEEVSREQAEQAAAERLLAGTPDLFDVPVEPDPVVAPTSNEVDIAPKEEPVQMAPETSEAPETPEVEANPVTVEMPAEDTEPDLSDAAVEEPAPQAEDVPAEDPQPAPLALEIPVADEPAPAKEETQAEAQQAVGASEAAPTSLAEQMERQAIADLRTAFSLVEKYECIKVLFQDDAMLFDRVLEALDGAGDFQVAMHWLHQHVPASKEWDQEDPTVLRFLERVQRRYV